MNHYDTTGIIFWTNDSTENYSSDELFRSVLLVNGKTLFIKH